MSRHHSFFGVVSVHLRDKHYDQKPTLFLKLLECLVEGVFKILDVSSLILGSTKRPPYFLKLFLWMGKLQRNMRT
jgi:hypothetical protein